MSIKLDYKQNYRSMGGLLRNPKPIFIILFYRVSSYFAGRRSNYALALIGIPVRVLYRLVIEWLMGIEIPDTTRIGSGLRIHHGIGIVINPHVVIGNNVTLKNNTTIGAQVTLDDRFVAAPVIEDNVIVHPHTIIFGDITIGKNSIIGAGSVVNRSVPPDSIVAGNPATVIKKR